MIPSSNHSEKSRKKDRWKAGLKILLLLLYFFFLVFLYFCFDPVSENITGLSGAKYGMVLLAIFCASTNLLFYLGSRKISESFFLLTNGSIRFLPAFLVSGCLMMALFPLIPYRWHPLLKDLHVWGTITGFILYQLFWISPLKDPVQRLSFQNPLYSDYRKFLTAQILLLACGWLIICLCAHISGAAEIFYAFSETLLLSLFDLKIKQSA